MLLTKLLYFDQSIECTCLLYKSANCLRHSVGAAHNVSCTLNPSLLRRAKLVELFPVNTKEFEEVATSLLNPLRPNNDLSQTSHCNIKGVSVSEVMRIENKITPVKFY